jgi:hypothetical protein
MSGVKLPRYRLLDELAQAQASRIRGGSELLPPKAGRQFMNLRIILRFGS